MVKRWTNESGVTSALLFIKSVSAKTARNRRENMKRSQKSLLDDPQIVLSSTALSLSLVSSFFSFLKKGTQRLEKKNYSHFLFELVRVRLCAQTSEDFRKGKLSSENFCGANILNFRVKKIFETFKTGKIFKKDFSEQLMDT